MVDLSNVWDTRVDAFALMYRNLGYTVIAISKYDRPSQRRGVDHIANLLIR